MSNMFNTFYEFWDLSIEQQLAMIGKCFQENGRYHLYFPVKLSNKWENYGREVGLIRISDIYKLPKSEYYWFRYGIASPDDDDREVDLTGHNLTKYRNIVIEYMESFPDTIKYPTDINSVLKGITDELRLHPSINTDVVKLDHSYAYPEWYK